jgi:hypothetical protein
LGMDVRRVPRGVSIADECAATGVQILPNLVDEAKAIYTWFRSPTHIIPPVAGENFKCKTIPCNRNFISAKPMQIAKSSDGFLLIPMSSWHIAKSSKEQLVSIQA